MQQVRQSVMIADDLAQQFTSVVSRMAKAAAGGDDGDLSSMRAESQRLYAAMWEHLDAAAAQTRTAGRSTDAYAAIRTDPSLDAHTGIAGVHSDVVDIEHRAKHDIVTVRGSVDANSAGVGLARQASTSLKQAWPELDWTPAPAQPEADLRPRGLLSRLFGRR